MDVTWGTAFQEMKIHARGRSDWQKPGENEVPSLEMKAAASKELVDAVRSGTQNRFSAHGTISAPDRN
jgi:hypothetical protein